MYARRDHPRPTANAFKIDLYERELVISNYGPPFSEPTVSDGAHEKPLADIATIAIVVATVRADCLEDFQIHGRCLAVTAGLGLE
jgi:hypothetical protein